MKDKIDRWLDGALSCMHAMSPADREEWASARTLANLGDRMARWLTRDIASWPGYQVGVGPDEETESIVDTLVAANRAGYVTTASQPGWIGHGYDRARWQLRPGVDGFADEAMCARLVRACNRAGLVVIPQRAGPTRVSYSKAMTVTEREGRAVTGFGTCLSRPYIARLFYGCSDEAVEALCKAWQVTIIDRDWGPGVRLWDTLDGLFDAGRA